jgi:long-chain acyl-CoA synthetase
MEIRYILEDSGANAIITNPELYPKVAEASHGMNKIKHIIVTNEEKPQNDTVSFEALVANGSINFSMATMGPDDLAVLMYTSGTTGPPKGVMLSHKNLSTCLTNGLPAWPTDKSDVYLVPLPLNHIYGMLMISECYVTGAHLVIHKWFDPNLVLESIARQKVTQFIGVPTMLVKLLEQYDPQKHNLSSIRRWISAAAPLSPETLKAVERELGGSVYEGYGMTEASPTISRQRTWRPKKIGSVGPPINEVDVCIMSEEGLQLQSGQEGEICARGPNIMIGYLNKPEETARTLRDGWLHTGDIGYIDDDGDLFITGRKKDLIIRGGENISPGSVEDILFAHPAVSEAAVVGVPDSVYGEEVKAFVVVRSGITVSEDELLNYCQSKLPRFKAPKSISFLKELPKSTVGKVLKRELRLLK